MGFRTVLASFVCAMFPSLINAAEIGVTMSMPQNLTAAAGQTVTVPVNLGEIASGFSLDSFQLIVEYDGNFFDTPLASGIKLGSLTTGKSYTGLDNIDPVSKSFTILRSNFSDPVYLTTDSSGSLMTFDISVKPGVALGSSGYLRFLASQGAATTEILTLSGDNIFFSPAITAPSVQGLVTVPVPEPSTYVLAVISTIAVAALARRRSSARKSYDSKFIS
ncbi:hypothetical protein GC170_09110 [bacterium]|nr:hypothetical protein [bacterium]